MQYRHLRIYLLFILSACSNISKNDVDSSTSENFTEQNATVESYYPTGVPMANAIAHFEDILGEPEINYVSYDKARYAYSGKSGLPTVDFWGKFEDIAEAGLVIVPTNDLQGAALNSAVLARFYINMLPELGEDKATDYFLLINRKLVKSLKTKHDFMTTDTIGIKKIFNSYSINNNMLAVTIQNIDSDE